MRAFNGLRDATDESRVANFVLPVVLIVLMYFMILVGASPAMQGVVEEKQQRISEVLVAAGWSDVAMTMPAEPAIRGASDPPAVRPVHRRA